jgi:hypothetical protein
MKKSPNKYQYQEDLIKGIKKGKLHVYGMGRGTGKSMWAKIEHNKYMLDMLQDKKPKFDDWHKGFTILPRRCKLTGKWVIGNVCVRERINYVPWTDPNGKVIEREYASAKEVFIRKLRNGNT